jgi:ABC-2 type transport system permease protein
MTGLVFLTAELRRSVRLARSYWLEYAADFVLYLAGFLLLMVVFRAASPDFGPEGYLSALLGYLTWKMCASVLVGIADTASEESQTGTLEQLFLAGRSPFFLFLGRAFGLITNQGLRAILLGTGLGLLLGILQPVTWEALLVFGLTLLGAVGFGFALAGLVLVFKRLAGATRLIWQMLVFFTGALAPIYHPVLAPLARMLPLTVGIESLRAIYLDGIGFTNLWTSGLLPGLLANTLVYLLLGVWLFRWGEAHARKLGLLGQY